MYNSREELLTDMAKAVGVSAKEVKEVIASEAENFQTSCEDTCYCEVCHKLSKNTCCEDCVTLAVAGEMTEAEEKKFLLPNLLGLAWVSNSLDHLILKASSIRASRT